MAPSSLEAMFETHWKQLAPDEPEPVTQYRFAAPRRWRADVAFLPERVIVELHGGTWVRGRHPSRLMIYSIGMPYML